LLDQPVLLDSTDVAHLMVLLKVARSINNPQHKDSWIDIAGYAACGAETALRGTFYRPSEQEVLEAVERLANIGMDKLDEQIIREAATPEGQSLLRRLGLEEADYDTIREKLVEAAQTVGVNPLDFDAVKEVIRERGLAA
jgi:hypothetical protein